MVISKKVIGVISAQYDIKKVLEGGYHISNIPSTTIFIEIDDKDTKLCRKTCSFFTDGDYGKRCLFFRNEKMFFESCDFGKRCFKCLEFFGEST